MSGRGAFASAQTNDSAAPERKPPMVKPKTERGLSSTTEQLLAQMKNCSVVLKRINVDQYLTVPSHQPQEHSSSSQSSSHQHKGKRKNQKLSPPRIRVLRNRNISIPAVAKNVTGRSTEILQHNKKESKVEVVSRHHENIEPTSSKTKKNRNEQEHRPSKTNLKDEPTALGNQNVNTANNNGVATVKVQINFNLCANEVSKKSPKDFAASCFENLLCGINEIIQQQKSTSSGVSEVETTTPYRNEHLAESRQEQSLSEALDIRIIDATEAPLELIGLDHVQVHKGVEKHPFIAIDEAFNKVVEDLSDVDEDEFDKLVYKKTKNRPMHSHFAPPTANAQDNSLDNLIFSGSQNPNHPATVSDAVGNETANTSSVAGTTESDELAKKFVESTNVVASASSCEAPSKSIAETTAIESIVASCDLGRAVLEATAPSETVAVSNQPSDIGNALTMPPLPSNSIELPTPMKQFMMKPRTKFLVVSSNEDMVDKDHSESIEIKSENAEISVVLVKDEESVQHQPLPNAAVSIGNVGVEMVGQCHSDSNDIRSENVDDSVVRAVSDENNHHQPLAQVSVGIENGDEAIIHQCHSDSNETNLENDDNSVVRAVSEENIHHQLLQLKMVTVAAAAAIENGDETMVDQYLSNSNEIKLENADNSDVRAVSDEDIHHQPLTQATVAIENGDEAIIDQCHSNSNEIVSGDADNSVITAASDDGNHHLPSAQATLAIKNGDEGMVDQDHSESVVIKSENVSAEYGDEDVVPENYDEDDSEVDSEVDSEDYDEDDSEDHDEGDSEYYDEDARLFSPPNVGFVETSFKTEPTGFAVDHMSPEPKSNKRGHSIAFAERLKQSQQPTWNVEDHFEQIRDVKRKKMNESVEKMAKPLEHGKRRKKPSAVLTLPKIIAFRKNRRLPIMKGVSRFIANNRP